MENKFECLTIISHMFDEFSMKGGGMNQRVLDKKSGEMMLLVPRPFLFIMLNEIRELSANTPFLMMETGVMLTFDSLAYPLHVSNRDANGEPLLRINGVLILASFDMTLNLYHVEATERLDDLLRVSVPLMPGMNIDDRIPGVNAVVFKIEKSFPHFGISIERAKLMN